MKIIITLSLFLSFLFSFTAFSQETFLEVRDIRTFTVSPDSKTIAFLQNWAGGSGAIFLYDIESKTYTKKIEHKTIDFYSSLHFSPDGKYLAWNKYGIVSFYDIANGKIESMQLHTENFTLSPINNLIVAGYEKDYELFTNLYDIKSLSVVKSINNNKQEWKGHISLDGNSFSTKGYGKVSLCYFFSNQQCQKYDLKLSYIDCYVVSNNNKYIAAFGDGMTILDLPNNSINKYELNKNVNSVIAACFSPLNQNIIYASYNAYKDPNYQIFISDLNGNILNTLKINQPKILTFSRNGKYFIALENFGIKIWHAKNILFYTDYYTKYYDMYFKDYQTELIAVYDKSKTKDEFETLPEYEARIASAFDLKKSIDDKYYGLISNLVNIDIEKQKSEYDKKNSEVQDKINKSIESVVTKISSVGTYIIESELLPVTINGVTENVKIKRDDAKSLKENFANAVVKGKKRLKYDLKTYEYFELTIIHPVSSVEYKFGNW